MKYFISCIHAILISLLLCEPVVWASGKSMVLVESYSSKPHPKSSEFLALLENYIIKSEKFNVINRDTVRKVLQEASASEETPILKTRGDDLFLDAQGAYLNLDFKLTKAHLASAVAELEKNPGAMGGLYKSHLLMAQVLLEENQNVLAENEMEKAIRLNPSQKELPISEYSPALAKTFKAVAKKISIDPKTISIVLKDDKTPVYVNGVSHGTGLKVLVPVDFSQSNIVSAGTTRLTSQKLLANKIIETVTFDNVSASVVAKKENPTGLKSSVSEYPLADAYQLGVKTHADYVTVFRFESAGYVSRVHVQVLDVKRQSISKAKVIDMTSVNDYLASASTFAGDYVVGLKTEDYSKEKGVDLPVLMGKKKKSSPALWAILGLAVIGGGVGAAMGMSGGGGGGGGGSTDTSVSLSGPSPSSP
ncbi:hypothetical protein K1X76_11750 [bacterium]|nr:hypothetical protein [bacterium]